MSKSADINLSFPYDWSNPYISDDTLIYIVLENAVYADLVKIMITYGAKKVLQVFNDAQWDTLTYKILNRMIRYARKGLDSD